MTGPSGDIVAKRISASHSHAVMRNMDTLWYRYRKASHAFHLCNQRKSIWTRFVCVSVCVDVCCMHVRCACVACVLVFVCVRCVCCVLVCQWCVVSLVLYVHVPVCERESVSGRVLLYQWVCVCDVRL